MYVRTQISSRAGCMAKFHRHADKNCQSWNHIQKIKECEILDEFSTLSKKVLASFAGVKPRHKGINLVSQIVPVDDNQGDKPVNKNLHDIGKLA
jgi:hypothetical protein